MNVMEIPDSFHLSTLLALVCGVCLKVGSSPGSKIAAAVLTGMGVPWLARINDLE